MLSINTNLASQQAANALGSVDSEMSTTMNQLSTGKMAVDAATADGAFVINLEQQEKSLGQFTQNAQNGLNLVNVASATLSQTTQMLEQMKVLAEQASNGVYSTNDIAGMNTKYQELLDEVQRNATTATFNGVALGTSSGSVTIFINDTSSLGVSIGLHDITTSGLGIDGTSLSAASTSNAITSLSAALNTIASDATAYSAAAQRVQFAVNSLTATQQNISAARSTVQDTDYASATSQLAKENVLKSAANAMLVQANKAPQSVSQLLQS